MKALAPKTTTPLGWRNFHLVARSVLLGLTLACGSVWANNKQERHPSYLPPCVFAFCSNQNRQTATASQLQVSVIPGAAAEDGARAEMGASALLPPHFGKSVAFIL